MPLPSLFGVVLIGLIAGTLARWLLGRRQALFVNLAVGVVGAILGAMVIDWLSLPVTGLLVMFGAAVVGAVALLSVLTLVKR
jgi:uncharacterized membrane protein YeaQ/YmgE (transglycosylase-associated protein family)